MGRINKSKNNFMFFPIKHGYISFKIADVETMISSYDGNGVETFTVYFESGYRLVFHSSDFENSDGLLKTRDALRSFIEDREDWVEK